MRWCAAPSADAGTVGLASTHILAALVAAQACQLLQELENVQERQQLLQLQQQAPADNGNGASSSRGVPPAVLLCGDFNTTPDSETVQVGTAQRCHVSCMDMLHNALWLLVHGCALACEQPLPSSLRTSAVARM
jgi:endonuclease/exonuclease/phosphatase family metal-dependent hydrolase